MTLPPMTPPFMMETRTPSLPSSEDEDTTLPSGTSQLKEQPWTLQSTSIQLPYRLKARDSAVSLKAAPLLTSLIKNGGLTESSKEAISFRVAIPIIPLVSPNSTARYLGQKYFGLRNGKGFSRHIDHAIPIILNKNITTPLSNLSKDEDVAKTPHPKQRVWTTTVPQTPVSPTIYLSRAVKEKESAVTLHSQVNLSIPGAIVITHGKASKWTPGSKPVFGEPSSLVPSFTPTMVAKILGQAFFGLAEDEGFFRHADDEELSPLADCEVVRRAPWSESDYIRMGYATPYAIRTQKPESWNNFRLQVRHCSLTQDPPRYLNSDCDDDDIDDEAYSESREDSGVDLDQGPYFQHPARRRNMFSLRQPWHQDLSLPYSRSGALMDSKEVVVSDDLVFGR